MSWVDGLLVAALGCWCAALLQWLVDLGNVSDLRASLQRAGCRAEGDLRWWSWLRVFSSIGLGVMAMWWQPVLPAVSWADPQSWWLQPLTGVVASAASLWLGWRAPMLILRIAIRRREQQLTRELPAFAERVSVALMCGVNRLQAMRYAAAHGSRPELGALMQDMVATGAPSSAVLAEIRGLARILRLAPARLSSAQLAAMLVSCLHSWSRHTAAEAYDGASNSSQSVIHVVETTSSYNCNSQ